MTDAVESPASRVVDNGNGTWTLPLLHPKTVKYRQGNQEREETFDSLTIRRMTGGDIRAMANIKQEGEQFATILCRLAGIAMPVFDKLDAEDIAAAGEVIADFLPAHLRTGAFT